MSKLSKEASDLFDGAFVALDKLRCQLHQEGNEQARRDLDDMYNTLDGIRDVIVGNIKTAA